MYLTARAEDVIESHTFESVSAFGGRNSKKLIEYQGPIVKLGLNTSIDFNKDNPVTIYFVDKEKTNAI